jgi:carbonic anhydrase
MNPDASGNANAPADHAHAAAPAAAHEPAPAGPTPGVALATLEEGNMRFVAGDAQGPRRDQPRRCETFGGQHPFAAILACADSRVPVEIVFDAGIGDLFTVRVAGNVADTDEIGTLEYGVDHLGIPLIVVLGHTKCGAVTAVVEGAEVHDNIAKLVDNIVPAAARTRQKYPTLKGQALVSAAVKMNVWQSMEDLISHSKVVREKLAAGKVKVVGGVYDLHSGAVEWMGEHPNQVDLLKGIVPTPPQLGEARPRSGSGDLPHGKPGKAAPAGQTSKAADHAVSPAAHEEEHPAGGKHDPAKPAKPEAAHADIEEHSNGKKATLEEVAGDEEKPSAGKKWIPHNPWALGACAAGGALISACVLHFVRPRAAAAAPAVAAESKE